MDTPSSLARLTEFFRANHRMPTWREMLRLFRYRSLNAVTKCVDRLIATGELRRDRNGHLSLAHPFNHTRVLGVVEAGFPSPAEEELVDTMSIDEYLIDHKEATYLLEVKGDSMIDEGIKEGDMVVAERKGEPHDGDIVIAEVDGGWTMKYFRKKGTTVYLEPANKKYRPIYPEHELKIAAIVRGVIRKYR